MPAPPHTPITTPEPRPEGYHPRAFPPVAVTVDIVVMTVVRRQLEVLLIQRGEEPHKGKWALPGGFVKPDEDLAAAAARELLEETGIDQARSLKQFRAYGEPHRDPRMRVVTVAYLAIVPRLAGAPRGGSDAAHAELVPVEEVQRGKLPLAFDHFGIVQDALAELGRDLETNAPHFCAPEFTIRELREVYEAIQKKGFDPGNFHRMVRRRERLIPTGGRALPGQKGGRPATLWQAPPPGERAEDRLLVGKAAAPASPRTDEAVKSEPERRGAGESRRSVQEILLSIEEILGELQKSTGLSDPSITSTERSSRPSGPPRSHDPTERPASGHPPQPK